MPRGDGLPRRLSLRDRDGVEDQVESTARLTANDLTATDRMVLNEAGIAVTARYVAAPEIEAGNLVRVLPGWSVPAVDVSLVMPAGKERSPAARAFVEFMRQRVAGNRRWFDDGAWRASPCNQWRTMPPGVAMHLVEDKFRNVLPRDGPAMEVGQIG
ncbi:LysR substrate-binding domain-containing protein [Mesorhizobium loti]|uniref:LysR substrate-binding domain-containing protein n=1 Tax=Rhizobium loti TaxID=381 RepID=UPI003CCC8BEB